MGLRSMYENNKQERELDKDLQLMEEQTQKILELQQQVKQLEQTLQKKDLQLSEALHQAEEWKNQEEQAENKIQIHLSEISKLKLEVQKLADKNEKLNEADNILKRNIELENQNKELKQSEQNARNEAEAKVSEIKREYQNKTKKLIEIQQKTEQLKKQVETTRSRQKALVVEKADDLYSRHKKNLENEYKARRASLEVFTLGLLLYGVLVTLFTAIRSEIVISDFKTFFLTIWSFIRVSIKNLFKMANWASQLGDKIPQEILALLVHWLILLLVCFVIGGGVIFLLFTFGTKLIDFYAENMADNTSIAVTLITLSVEVFFGEWMRTWLPVNLLFLFLIVHGVYIGIRAYLISLA